MAATHSSNFNPFKAQSSSRSNQYVGHENSCKLITCVCARPGSVPWHEHSATTTSAALNYNFVSLFKLVFPQHFVFLFLTVCLSHQSPRTNVGAAQNTISFFSFYAALCCSAHSCFSVFALLLHDTGHVVCAVLPSRFCCRLAYSFKLKWLLVSPAYTAKTIK